MGEDPAMVIGIVGCGNMGSALARGMGVPAICSDVDAALAQRLAADTGGEAVATNAEVAERADLVLLCHKPHQLEEVAEQLGGRAKAVASILGGVGLAALEAAYPSTPVIRLMPNTPVEIRRGVICVARGSLVEDALAAELEELLERCGKVFAIEDRLMDVAMALISVAPAYVALFAEGWIDAGVAHGMPAHLAGPLVAEAIAGSGDLIAAQDADTLGVRRAVTTPGGVTAQGLAALERAGTRAALRDALDAVLRHLD
jgi:pyrroline-5-carboxylate reductase